MIESGPTQWNGLNPFDGSLHPYGSSIDSGGHANMYVDYGIILASGGQYRYYSNLVSGTTFQSVYCSGAGCIQMQLTNTGISAMNRLDSGGEGNDASSTWGTVTTKYNTYIQSGTSNSVPWCWNVAAHSGTNNVPSNCFNSGNGQINAWTAKYP